MMYLAKKQINEYTQIQLRGYFMALGDAIHKKQIHSRDILI